MAGSPYFGGSSSGGSAYFGGGGGGAPAKKSGGILGKLEGAGHYFAQKAGLAAHDLKSIPGGLIEQGKVTGNDIIALAEGAPASDPRRVKANKLGNAIVQGFVQSLEHPLRDPFQTAVNVATIGHAGAGAAARVGEVSRTGDVGALARDVPIKPRTLKVGDEHIPLVPSKSPLVRAGQSVHDKVVQKAIDTNPEGKLANYGTKRAGSSLDETARYQQRIREAPANALTKAGKRLTSKTHRGVGRVRQAALELTSVNTSPEDAAAYHLKQAADGVEARQNLAVAHLYKKVSEQGLLTKNEHGDMVVNVEAHPKLALADLHLAHVQGRGDEILTRYGVRSAEELKARVNAPGRFRAGATYESPTPGKNGVASQKLIAARARVERIGALVDKAEVQQPLEHLMPNYLGGRGDTARVAGLRGAHAHAKEELQRLEDAHVRRQKPTGIVGGETARPGRGFTSYALDEKRAPSSPAAASPGPVVGETKSPITKKTLTGEGIAKGFVPKDVTGAAARHFRSIVRFVNTTERRNSAIRSGHDVRESTRDVLVKMPGAEYAKIPKIVEEALGRKKPTTDDVAGIQAALDAYKEDLVPGLADRFAGDRQHPVGTSATDAAAARGLDAPEGYKWVDRNLLGELGKPPAGPRGKIATTADSLNSAVTAATVYFKIGHVGTRVLTNAATNIIQGSLNKGDLSKAYALWHALDDEYRSKALGASGQHSFDAMPHEGTNRVARIAGWGANQWAKHADAPFRFNSIAYEARKAGFDTPEKFRYMLDKLEDGGKDLKPDEWAKIDRVAKEANRAGIAYDRLNSAERRFITRGLWFYPWVAGATRFAVHTATEHPFKTAGIVNAGVQGRNLQAQELGDLPSYEGGLFQVGKPDKTGRPLVADFSTFSPFSTPADVLNAVARPGELSGFLNPVYGATDQLINGQNQYGTKSTHPVTDALASLFSPTPEAQIVSAYLGRHKDQSGRMFRTTPGSALKRTLVGPGLPRRINLAAAHKSAGREKSGR